MNDVKEVYILLRMRYFRFAGEPEVYEDMKAAKAAFDEYTGMSYDVNQALAEEAGADPDELLGGPFSGTRILTVEVNCASLRRHAA